MAGYKLTISAPKASTTADHIEQLGHNAEHAHSAFESIADLLLLNQKERWGKGWKKDAASTLQGKRARGQSTRTGEASGALKRSLTEKGAPHQIFEVSDQEARIGTNLYYARWFDKGRGDNQPARKAIRLTKAGRQEIARIVAKHITDVE